MTSVRALSLPPAYAPQKRSRILAVMRYAPYPQHINGGATRFVPILNYLEARHDLQVVYVSENAYGTQTGDVPDWVRTMKVVRERPRSEVETRRAMLVAAASLLGLGPPWRMKIYDIDAILARMLEIIDDFKPDVVLWGMGGHAIADAVRQARPMPRWIFDFCDSPGFAIHRQNDKARCLSEVRRYEQKLIRDAALSIFISDFDASFVLAGQQPSNVVVLPNGIELPSTADLRFDSPNARADLGYIGHMGYRPNIEAAQCLQRIHAALASSRPGLRLKLIGQSPSPQVRALASDAVAVTGAVDNKWREIASVSIFVFPLKSGTGLQNKLLEAWAAGKAVVASPIVAEPAGAVDGEHLLIARTEEEFVAAIARLLDDPALAGRLGEAGRRYVQERFDWANILPRYEQALLGWAPGDRMAGVGVRG